VNGHATKAGFGAEPLRGGVGSPLSKNQYQICSKLILRFNNITNFGRILNDLVILFDIVNMMRRDRCRILIYTRFCCKRIESFTWIWFSYEFGLHYNLPHQERRWMNKIISMPIFIHNIAIKQIVIQSLQWSKMHCKLVQQKKNYWCFFRRTNSFSWRYLSKKS